MRGGIPLHCILLFFLLFWDTCILFPCFTLFSSGPWFLPFIASVEGVMDRGKTWIEKMGQLEQTKEWNGKQRARCHRRRHWRLFFLFFWVRLIEFVDSSGVWAFFVCSFILLLLVRRRRHAMDQRETWRGKEEGSWKTRGQET